MSDMDKNKTEDPWELFRYFLGRWSGTGTGRPGESRAEREYRFVLNEQFIQINHRSVFEPQEKNPEGEVHEEFGFLSYDRTRKTHVLREFHVEGFVNQYKLAETAGDGRKLVLQTEAIENIPPGWQAQVTLEILDDDEFRERFDLAGPGQEWDCYITNLFKRMSME